MFEFVMHHLDQGLPGFKAFYDFLANSALGHPGDKITHHGQGHVGFKKRNPELAQRLANIVLGQPSAASQALERTCEAFCELVKPRQTLVPIVSRPLYWAALRPA